MNTSKPLEERAHQQRNHQQVKPKNNKRAHTSRRKGNPRISRQGDQRDHITITESHRTPTIKDHPTKTASKAAHQVPRKQTKRVTENEETKT